MEKKMRRKKLVRKLGFITLITFIVSITIILLQFPYWDWQKEKRRNILDEHITGLTKNYNEYLRQMESKINSIPVTQNIKSELESEFLFESQQTNKIKKCRN